MVEVLREQNRAFGAGADTSRNLDRLANGAAAIVTGQQVGLFTGPAYSLYKAISAVRYAEEASKMASMRAGFLAGDRRSRPGGNQSRSVEHERQAPRNLSCQSGGIRGGPSVGEVKLGRGITALVAKAAESLEGSFRRKKLDGLCASLYTPEETYGSAFGKLMARLLAGRGIIFLDPLDRAAASFCSERLSPRAGRCRLVARGAAGALERARARRISCAGESYCRIHAAFLQCGRTPGTAAKP